MSVSVSLTVNGRPQVIKKDQDASLLFVLRNDLQLNGPKFGCGLGQCGSCSVLVDGKLVRSCTVSLSSVSGKSILTLEGLTSAEGLDPIQKAFLAEQAAQCGYCSNGMIMAARALLDDNPNPSRAEIVETLDSNLCRCGTHLRIIRAVERAARERGSRG